VDRPRPCLDSPLVIWLLLGACVVSAALGEVASTPFATSAEFVIDCRDGGFMAPAARHTCGAHVADERNGMACSD
jgi:hypothetical protein